jgi:hypothetical protein
MKGIHAKNAMGYGRSRTGYNCGIPGFGPFFPEQENLIINKEKCRAGDESEKDDLF